MSTLKLRKNVSISSAVFGADVTQRTDAYFEEGNEIQYLNLLFRSQCFSLTCNDVGISHVCISCIRPDFSSNYSPIIVTTQAED